MNGMEENGMLDTRDFVARFKAGKITVRKEDTPEGSKFIYVEKDIFDKLTGEKTEQETPLDLNALKSQLQQHLGTIEILKILVDECEKKEKEVSPK